MELFIDDHRIDAQPGESLVTLIRKLGLDSPNLNTRPLAADIGGEVFTLNYVPYREIDALPSSMGYRERKAIRSANRKISLIRYDSSRGNRVYERTLLFVFCLAARRIMPEAKVYSLFTLGQGLYLWLNKKTGLTAEDIAGLKAECEAIIKEDFPLERKRLDIDEAIRYFEADKQQDKVRLLQWRRFDYFDVYRKDDYTDYFYGELCPSTGYASVFDLVPCSEGVLLLKPDPADLNRPAVYKPLPHFQAAFRESDEWGTLMECANVADLNELIENGRVRELIRVNEALHERKFTELATEIVNKGAKAVFLAGPSSSGKTTSANRLCTQLRVLGKKPTLISLDDYYLDRDLIPREPDGSVDLEHIRTINTKRFAEDLDMLLHGKEVELPMFDFTEQKSKRSGRLVRSSEDAPILIEGIHGLNPALLPVGFDTEKIFKLFVSALTTLNLDDHNRIPTSDIRLLRRMVRDYLTRGSSVERTLGMWKSVQAGEQRWIFPFQEEADAIMNTSLVYEFAVLKTHIYPILQNVGPQSPCYDQVRSILKFLNYVLPADVEDEIPPTSILREFIGGNTFYRS